MTSPSLNLSTEDPRRQNAPSKYFVSSPHKKYPFIFKNDPAELRLASGWLHDLCQAKEIHSDIAFKFDLCLNEIVSNIISHSLQKEETEEIRIHFCVTETLLLLEVEDDGDAFNPLAHIRKPAFSDIRQATVGGLGLYLIKAFMDETFYERRGRTNYLRLGLNRT